MLTQTNELRDSIPIEELNTISREKPLDQFSLEELADGLRPVKLSKMRPLTTIIGLIPIAVVKDEILSCDYTLVIYGDCAHKVKLRPDKIMNTLRKKMWWPFTEHFRKAMSRQLFNKKKVPYASPEFAFLQVGGTEGNRKLRPVWIPLDKIKSFDDSDASPTFTMTTGTVIKSVALWRSVKESLELGFCAWALIYREHHTDCEFPPNQPLRTCLPPLNLSPFLDEILDSLRTSDLPGKAGDLEKIHEKLRTKGTANQVTKRLAQRLSKNNQSA